MELHKKDLGTWGELYVSKVLIENGYSVFHSLGDNSKIDLIAVDNAYNTHRLQVKAYSRRKGNDDVTEVKFGKSGPGYTFTYTSQMFDWLVIVDVITQKIAWIPVSIFEVSNAAKPNISLRHTQPKNNISNVHMFDEFTDIPF
jgi:hypothetical protein